MSALHPKADVDLPMSVFLLITSGIGGKADVDISDDAPLYGVSINEGFDPSA